MDFKSDQLMCDFCLSQKSRYCCSRCHRRYCSSICFRSEQHIECSEQFFKECVTQELISQRFNDSSKQKFLEILKRNGQQIFDKEIITNNDNNNIDNEDVLIDERFKDLDLNDSHQLWNCLNDSERQEFEQLLKSGEIGTLIDVWQPWWLTDDTNISIKPLVTPIDETSVKDISNNISKLPQILSNITNLKELISKPVSPAVCPAVINTLISYCYTCRLFNGDYDTIDSIEVFIRNCPQLSQEINCDDLNKSLEMTVQQIMTEQPSNMALQVLNDCKHMIDGPKFRLKSCETSEYVMRALSDMIYTVKNVKKKCSKQKRKDLKLDALVKKLEFYLSWTLDNAVMLTESVFQIKFTIDSLRLMNNPNEAQDIGQELRRKLCPKTLIEEIN
ncbi:uncharacterized protein LOC128960909 [Oppia nitens]|uniref:uncharacterized protein LOC128960909 n=1 Tax=Oppia nitens TaxID=1686743 RepID=UPI0023DB85B8|nr:uncharacterized protein LOC128960909 [Oppia nitens]